MYLSCLVHPSLVERQSSVLSHASNFVCADDDGDVGDDLEERLFSSVVNFSSMSLYLTHLTLGWMGHCIDTENLQPALGCNQTESEAICDGAIRSPPKFWRSKG